MLHSIPFTFYVSPFDILRQVQYTLGACFLLVTFYFILSTQVVHAQAQDHEFKSDFLKLNSRAFAFAGGWSVGNMAFSGTELILLNANNNSGSELYRAQMNLGWSAVNTAIFALGYRQQMKLSTDPKVDWLEQHRKTKRAFMINTFLDVLYIGAGALLTQYEKGEIPRNQGFGQAIMFQGSFLLGFDAFMWWKNSRLKKKYR